MSAHFVTAMSRNYQFLALFLFYTITIVGVCFWSGTVSQKTLYDKYIISLDGLLVPSQSKDNQVDFYSKILDFQPLRHPAEDASREIFSFQFPGKRKLLIEQVQETPSITPIIRVRNGFQKLHNALVRRSGQPEQPTGSNLDWTKIAKGTVSNVFDGSFGPEFLVCDAEGNKILFYNAERKFFRVKK